MLPGILDFEASGFGVSSYPIEVGYARGGGEKFCVLIRPHRRWTYWDARAEKVHGITRNLLMRSGADVGHVCQELNRRLAGLTLYSDGWVTDKEWMNKLYEAGRLQPSFRLSAIENIQSECQHLMWDQVLEQMRRESNVQRHRASSDAEFIQQVFMRTQSLCDQPKM